jgi:hypothetical protein
VKHRIFALLVLGAAVLSAGAICGEASEVVEIHLRGRYFIEPATVHITVAVEPDEANRVLRIEADGDQVFRASDLSLSGANEKRMHSLQFKNLPAGSYTLRAQVFSSDSMRGQAEQQLLVTGAGMR